MNIRNYKEPKPRRDYVRNYDEDGKLKSIDVGYSDIKELVGKKQVLETIKWLNETNSCMGRFDITVGVVATKIAKQVLINEERQMIKDTPNKKENSLLSSTTYKYINTYIFNLYEEFKNYGLINYNFTNRRVTFVKNNEEVRRNELTVAAIITEKGIASLTKK